MSDYFDRRVRERNRLLNYVLSSGGTMGRTSLKKTTKKQTVYQGKGRPRVTDIRTVGEAVKALDKTRKSVKYSNKARNRRRDPKGRFVEGTFAKRMGRKGGIISAITKKGTSKGILRVCLECGNKYGKARKKILMFSTASCSICNRRKMCADVKDYSFLPKLSKRKHAQVAAVL